MATVENRRKGSVTIVSTDGRSGTIELMQGINKDVPDWVLKEEYFKLLRKDGQVTALKDDEEATLPQFKLDANGKPIQAVDDKGEPIFDEESGEPVFVPADEE